MNDKHTQKKNPALEFSFGWTQVVMFGCVIVEGRGVSVKSSTSMKFFMGNKEIQHIGAPEI